MIRLRYGASRTTLARLSVCVSSIAVAAMCALLLGASSPAQGASGLSELRADFNAVPDGVQRYTGGLGIGAPACFLRDVPGNEILPTIVQHQMDGILGPELMSHTVTDKRDLTYTARGHVMTAPFNIGGFQICDNPVGSFVQGGSSTFSVDISTAGVASRKWPLIWFILDGSLKTPLPGDPAFTDTVRDHAAEVSVPSSAIFFKPESFNGTVGWGGWRTDGDRFGAYWEPIPVLPDFITRTPHQFVVDGRAIEVWVGGIRLWREENVVPAAWDGQRVDVRLDFVDYNSEKEGFGATTWHWDNVRLTGQDIQPAPGATSSITPVDSPQQPSSPATEGPIATSTSMTSTPTPTAEPSPTATPPTDARPSSSPWPFLPGGAWWRALRGFIGMQQ